MLNTTIHNPAVKDKPSVERFITMNMTYVMVFLALNGLR
jgi:Sec7-like guanine-nucleotide exchange factor